jgi:triosephosphate isomerase
MAKNWIIGNWKMNLNQQEVEELTNDIELQLKQVPSQVQVAIAPSSIYLQKCVTKFSGSSLQVGSQNIHHKPKGAYTGEVSAEMVSSMVAKFSLIGHSERREYFNETSDQLKSKVKLALDNDLMVVYCCGESLEVRENGNYIEYILNQIEEVLFDLATNHFENIVIAYEPIWAIGTGKTATAQQAQEVHAAIRAKLSEKLGHAQAQEVSILYGGSCKPSNAQELFSQADINGGLIGGASLNASDFIALTNSF